VLTNICRYLQEKYVEDMMDEVVAKLVALDSWYDEPDVDMPIGQ
jgi:hypothetical protein